MKTRLILATTWLMSIALVSCSSQKANSENKDDKDMKTLVLYYSQTGTTKTVAEALQSKLNADIEAIDVDEPYSGTYDETIQRVLVEREQGILPNLNPIHHKPKDYDIVFLGYPIWFGTYAPPIAELLKTIDFAGVHIVPFCTFGSGGIEASANDIKVALPNATIMEGYGVRSARIAKMSKELDRFLIENGYIQGDVNPLPAFSEKQPVTDAETAIFNAACGNYQFPLGTPINFSQRSTPDGKEYRYEVKSITPDGQQADAIIYVIDNGTQPEFTKVVR